MADGLGPAYDMVALPSGKVIPASGAAAAIEEIRRAVLDAGPRPDYHAQQVQRLRREWPTLWHAIEALVNETGGR